MHLFLIDFWNDFMWCWLHAYLTFPYNLPSTFLCSLAIRYHYAACCWRNVAKSAIVVLVEKWAASKTVRLLLTVSICSSMQWSQPSRPSAITADGDGRQSRRPSKGRTETAPSFWGRTGTDCNDGQLAVPGRHRPTSMDLLHCTL